MKDLSETGVAPPMEGSHEVASALSAVLPGHGESMAKQRPGAPISHHLMAGGQVR